MQYKLHACVQGFTLVVVPFAMAGLLQAVQRMNLLVEALMKG